MSRADLAALIVRMAVDQDRKAFDCLYRACGPEIMGMLRGRAGSAIDHSHLDDICQEAFETAWRRSHAFDPAQHDPIVWIFEISRNVAIETLHLQFQQVDVADGLRSSIPPPRGLDESLEAAIERAALRQAVAALTPKEAALLRDVYDDGLTHSQIAKKRGLPLGTVKATLRGITVKLRAAVARARP